MWHKIAIFLVHYDANVNTMVKQIHTWFHLNKKTTYDCKGTQQSRYDKYVGILAHSCIVTASNNQGLFFFHLNLEG